MTNILGNIASGFNGRATKLIVMAFGVVLGIMLIRRR